MGRVSLPITRNLKASRTMIAKRVAEYLTDALCGLARANWFEFARDPKLCRVFDENLRGGGHRYYSDRSTCGLADCWSSYRALVDRYQVGHGRFCRIATHSLCQNHLRLIARHPKKVLLDCEDAAAALSGWLSSQCYGKDRILIGLVPGSIISHAISGVMKPDGSIKIMDPALWCGMGEMGKAGYANPVWRDVATQKAPIT